VHRLDLHAHAHTARILAAARWWAWRHQVTGTPPAKPGVPDPTTGNRPGDDGARQRFQAQPRVLAMLAYNSFPTAVHHLDPSELAEYQAGEAVYVALHWHHALTGDALVDAHGRLLRPASTSIADRLRYQADATRVVYALPVRDVLVAIRAAAP
jgi:hypothetical protein